MRRNYYIIPLCAAYLLFMGAPLTSCNSNSKDELAHHTHSHGHNEEGHEHGEEDHEHGEDEHTHSNKGHNGKEIVLESAQAKTLGVVSTAVHPSSFHSVIKVSGMIVESASGGSLASSPTNGTITFASGISEGKYVKAGTTVAVVRGGTTTGGNANEAARAALEAARKEMERLKPLHEHGIVSTAEWNAAVAAYKSAKASYSPAAASGRIVAPSSGTITQLLVKSGQIVDAGTPVAKISGGSMLNLRADLPQRHYAAVSQITGAKFRTPYSDVAVDIAELGGKKIEGNAVSTSRPGYIPVYFSFSNNGEFAPGTPVEVFLLGAPSGDVISVPKAAISEQQGKYFVYVQIDEECYQKRPVELGESDGNNIAVLSGINPGDKVVTKGAVSVRLAESSGVVPEGHSHSH